MEQKNVNEQALGAVNGGQVIADGSGQYDLYDDSGTVLGIFEKYCCLVAFTETIGTPEQGTFICPTCGAAYVKGEKVG